MKTDEQRRARELCAEGRSVKEIERLLGVSRNSVSRWVRDVRLSPAQRDVLVSRSRLGAIVAAERKAVRAREARRAMQEAGRRLIHERDRSYAAGCMLYWAEGARERNTVRIVNSDPELLVIFAAFLRTHFEVPDDRMAIRCNLFADHLRCQRETEQYWLHRLGLPDSSLRKSMVNVFSTHSKKKRLNKLKFGTCELRVLRSTQIVQTIYGSIQEYGGFDRPEWLD